MIGLALIVAGYVAIVANFGWTGLVVGAIHLGILALGVKR